MSFFDSTSQDDQELQEYKFDDEYDNLEHRLDESEDAFNDVTFGDISVGRDFDFFGETTKISSALEEDQISYERKISHHNTQHQAPPSLQPMAMLWDEPDKNKRSAGEISGPNVSSMSHHTSSAMQPLSLEQIEAQLIGQSSQVHSGYGSQGSQVPQINQIPAAHHGPQVSHVSQINPIHQIPQVLQIPQVHQIHQVSQCPQSIPSHGYPFPQGPQGVNVPNFSQHPGQRTYFAHPWQFIPSSNHDVNLHMMGEYYPNGLQGSNSQALDTQSSQESQVLNNLHGTELGSQISPQQNTLDRFTDQIQEQVQTHFFDKNVDIQQQSQNIDQDMQNSQVPAKLTKISPNYTIPSMDENERLAKRNEIILKRKPNNHLMTSANKDFVLRVQLQQMVTDDPYNEDFYYQVHSVINLRSNPNQPLDAFARTYLYQRGQRRRGYDNESGLQRLQQQVHQAVQFVKDKPRKESIGAEGALGRIYFGSNKAPRQALDLRKREASTLPSPSQDSSGTISTEPSNNGSINATTDPIRAITSSIAKISVDENYVHASDRRAILRAIENVYVFLLRLEASERSQPEDKHSDDYNTWKKERDILVEQLWKSLQITVPIDQGHHPFIAMLSHAKCKKAIPRVFRHIVSEQRLTIITMIVAHIGHLDVVLEGKYSTDSSNLSPKILEAIEVFSQTVLPALVQYISEAPYGVIAGLLELMMDRNDIAYVVKTKVGSAFVTVLISRAELINQEGIVSLQDEQTWNRIFNRVFDIIQRSDLNTLFPPPNIDDSYVWQFLASIALAAKIDHQRIMVDNVRNKIFSTMNEAKTLPPDLSYQKINNLNLFLNVMGLNATPTEIGELKA